MINIPADENAVAKAAKVLSNGGVVVYPTDTLYGAGGALSHPEAVHRIFTLKNMEPGPHSIIMADREMVEKYAELTPVIIDFLEQFPVGAYTLILPVREEKRDSIPPVLIKDGNIAIRLPDSDISRNIAREVGPFTSTSANLHGRPSPRMFKEISLEGADLYLDGGPTK